MPRAAPPIAAPRTVADSASVSGGRRNPYCRIVASIGQTSEGGRMRGFHCVDPSHDRVEFTGADDEDLFQSIKAHAAEAHPELTDSQIREMMAGADWGKEMANSGVNAGS